MKIINKKPILATILASLALSLGACSSQEQTEKNVKISNLYSERTSYSVGDNIILNFGAASKSAEYVIKNVKIKYFIDNINTSLETFTVHPKDTVSTITEYVVATNVFKKNEKTTQKFEITEFSYTYNGQVFDEKTDVSYTVGKKGATEEGSYVALDDFNFQSSSAGVFTPISTDGMTKNYEIKRNILANSSALLEVTTSSTVSSNVKSLYWLVRCTMADGSVHEMEKPENNLHTFQDTEWITHNTRKIEIYGAMYRLDNEVQTRTETFDVVPTINITVVESDVKVNSATIRTESSYSSLVTGTFYAGKTDKMQMVLDITCGNGTVIKEVNFAYEKGGKESVVKINNPSVKYTPRGNGMLTASVTATIAFETTGTYTFKRYDAFYGIEGEEGTLQAESLTKELKLNVLDGLISSYSDLKTLIAENPNGYFALVAPIEISYNTDYFVEEFTGTIDGNGYKITEKYCSSAWFKTNKGTIKNLTFYNPIVNISKATKSQVLLAETNLGTISNITVDGGELNITEDDAEFCGLVHTNKYKINNIELFYRSLAYKGNYYSPKFTGLCKVNEGRVNSVYAVYDSGFTWVERSGDASFTYIDRYTKILNCVIETNSGTGQLDDGSDKGLLDTIVYFMFVWNKNFYNKINLFFADGNGSTARLFFLKEGIEPAFKTTVLNIVTLSDTTNETASSKLNTAIEKLLQGIFINDADGTTYGKNYNRPYILGFDTTAIYANESWKDSNGTLHTKKCMSISHCAYAECFNNVGFVSQATYTPADSDIVFTSATQYNVYDGKVNSGVGVAYSELHTDEFLFGTSKGTFLSNQYWNSNIKLMHTRSFTVSF